jgi:hypothetical protein
MASVLLVLLVLFVSLVGDDLDATASIEAEVITTVVREALDKISLLDQH